MYFLLVGTIFVAENAAIADIFGGRSKAHLPAMCRLSCSRNFVFIELHTPREDVEAVFLESKGPRGSYAAGAVGQGAVPALCLLTCQADGDFVSKVVGSHPDYGTGSKCTGKLQVLPQCRQHAPGMQ